MKKSYTELTVDCFITSHCRILLCSSRSFHLFLSPLCRRLPLCLLLFYPNLRSLFLLRCSSQPILLSLSCSQLFLLCYTGCQPTRRQRRAKRGYETGTGVGDRNGSRRQRRLDIRTETVRRTVIVAANANTRQRQQQMRQWRPMLV